jgi:hypothetical protein
VKCFSNYHTKFIFTRRQPKTAASRVMPAHRLTAKEPIKSTKSIPGFKTHAQTAAPDLQVVKSPNRLGNFTIF